MKKQLLTASLLLSSAFAFGAGFQLNLQGLRQLAMGGTGTAWPWDASTIFYNPGGISRLDGIQVCASGLFIMPRTEYAAAGTSSYTAYTQPQTFYPFNLYVGGPVKKGSKIGVGIGVYTPFGSGIKWDNDWAGRYMAQSIYLESIFVQPTVSYRFNDFISVGAGFVYAFGNLDFKEALPVQNENSQDGEADLSGNAHGAGFNVGVQIKATNNLQFGITYRSQVNMKLNSGTANFTVPASLEGYFPNTSFSSSLPLPQVASIGVGYRPISKLTLQFDMNYVGWSSYDSLDFNFSEHTADLQNIHAPRHYQNTLAFRLGAAYEINKQFTVMAGTAYDPTPVADGFVSPELPDANHYNLNCGLTYTPIKKLTIMAAMEYTTTAKRQSTYVFDNFDGTYQTKAITPGIGLSYNF
jgi:long-chain fatty acid transport protein